MDLSLSMRRGKSLVTRTELEHPDNVDYIWEFEPQLLESIAVDGNQRQNVIWRVEEPTPIKPTVDTFESAF